VDGVVVSVDVLEGASVKAGETVVGRLASAALQAALERAERALAQRESAHAQATAEHALATALLAQRLDLRREVARLEGEHAVAKAALATAEADLESAAQALEAAREDVRAQERLEAAGAGTSVPKAKAAAEQRAAEAAARGKRADLGRAQAGVATAAALLALAVEARDRPEALAGAEKTAAARVAASAADVDAATTDLEVAKREASWLTVVAPVDGVVLRREASPGSVVGPSAMPRAKEGERMSDSGEGGIVSLYDPRRLQARIDVPLSSVAGIGAGRKAELTVEAVPGRTFHGVVTRVQSQADALKNTLQVKVRIDDPDPALRPEMLVRARFLAEPAAAAVGAGASRVLVPKAALRGDAVFVVDPRGGGRARRVPVSPVAEEGEWVEVKGDVSRTHRVILDPVSDGERVDGGGS
jgi:membrane fusion protein (multidrug efflux system)